MVCVAAPFAVAAGARPVLAAERPSAMQLFPHDTLLFVRSPNARELAKKLRDTSTGRMLADPQIKPFVDKVLGEASTLYSEEAEWAVGLSWEEVTDLPHGEFALGVVARPNAGPAYLLLADEGDQQAAAGNFVNSLLSQADEAGAPITTETIDGVEVTVLHQFLDEDTVLGYFVREGTVVAATDPNLLRHVLHYWNAASPTASSSEPSAPSASQKEAFVPGPTLDTNENFLAILKELRRPAQDPPPNLIIYADPIELVRAFGRARPGWQIGLAFLPQLGLDGVQAVGVSMIAATDQYDSLNHFHVLLRNPRQGVLSMLAFDTGDQKPQAWVPLDAESYTTGNWKVQPFYERLASIVDRFQGEGAFDRLVGGRLSRQLGIDFKTEIIDNLSGRISRITSYVPPYSLESRQQVFAFELADEAAAQATLRTILTQLPDRFEDRQVGPVTYHAIRVPRLEEMPEDERPPIQPFVAVLDKNLFIGTSAKIFEQMVLARQGETPQLADSQDYEELAKILSAESVSMRPAGLMVVRPEVMWRYWYELLQSDTSLVEQSETDEPVAERLAAVLREGTLPPFDALKKYLAPAGVILYDTDNGVHAIMFDLRRD
jgi:hypothetical protein